MTGIHRKDLRDLYKGKVQVELYVGRQNGRYFQYPGQEPLPVIPGYYRVADTKKLLLGLEKFWGQDSLSGIIPGELLDSDGKAFTVMGPGLSVFEDDPDPEPVRFSDQDFVIEKKPVRDSELATFMRLFRSECPEGGMPQFAVWADGREDVELIFFHETGSWNQVQWKFPGKKKEPAIWSYNTIKNNI